MSYKNDIFRVVKTALYFMLLSSCGYLVQKPFKRFSELVENPADRSGGRLSFDGAYHHITDYNIPQDYVKGIPTRYVDTPYLQSPIFFFPNGLIAFSGGFLDSVTFKDAMAKWGVEKRYFLNNWGVYETKADTVRAIIYYPFTTSNPFNRSRRKQCYFEGIIKNKDTILQWHMVAPYPKGRGDDPDRVKLMATPKNLYFKRVPIREVLNPEEAWINEF